MYKVKDAVRYSPYGVCQITAKVTRTIGEASVECFVLKPVYNENCSLLIPLHNHDVLAKLQPLLTEQEVYELISDITDQVTITSTNNAQHKKQFAEILINGDRRMLIRMIKTLHEQQKKLEQIGKKLSTTDERFMQEAEKQLYEEFSFVLNIDPDQVPQLIMEHGDFPAHQHPDQPADQVREAV